MKDRRICIVISMGWGVRNVLMSRAMESVAERCRAHLLTPFSSVEAFRNRFSFLGPMEELVEPSLSPLAERMKEWNTTLFFQLSPSATHRLKLGRRQRRRAARRTARRQENRPPLNLRRLFDMVTPGTIRESCNRIISDGLDELAKRYASRRMFDASHRWMLSAYRRCGAYEYYAGYFRRHGIDTLITSNPLNPAEYPALVAARDLGLNTIAIITSWDNLTSKRPLIVEFDRYLVWNPIMASEVRSYYDQPPERIHDIGPLQFDFYFDPRYIDSRDEFCRRLGLDPARRIVVYSGVTKMLQPDEPRIVEKLLVALKDGRVAGKPNLIFRNHPKRDLREFRPLMDDPRWKGLPVAWTEPGSPVGKTNDLWCPMDDEIRLLTNTVVHTDVNVNCFSTMMLDCAVLDKPAVMICHDSQDGKLHYEAYEHLKPVLATRGNRIGYTFEETLAHLNAYLADPSLDRAGRKAMIDMQCGPHLGNAWRRLAEVILCESAETIGQLA